MSNKTLKTIYLVYGIVVSALLIISGILLMISCVQIYNLGNRPFTTENISEAFSKIAIPVYITVGAIAIGFIMWLIFPTSKTKTSAIISKESVLKRLEKKLDRNACDEQTIKALNKEVELRKLVNIAVAVICCAAAGIAFNYILNFSNYTADNNGSVIAACMWVLPCTFIALGACIAASFIKGASIERQINVVKTAIKAGYTAPAVKEAAPCKCHCKKLLSCIRLAVFIIAALFIVAGIFNGGMSDVLGKAVRICTECIGLG